ncbi:hypothetical protein [Serratia sp. Se-RSBMAAmG]|uniref:hypothetical protein n=1 Tax=Serratia sp. Se-RSBMAAmG TaxID=3043305 RepID=UPI0024AE8CB8|nr:hypothetical protein [Serratia sp. Se-RSBMAAmG]MDI6975974.1 hypothetical protein [Serratia sp. Se-RSBMAAmG]
MLKFGNKTLFNQKTSNAEKSVIKRKTWKPIVIGALCLFGGFATYDVAVTASNIAHINKMVDYKIADRASLDNYSSFKARVMAVPYTDAQFKKDLNTFEYIYGYKGTDNAAFKKYMWRDGPVGSGVELNTMLQMNFNLDNLGEFYKDVYNFTKGLDVKKMTGEREKDFYRKISAIHDKHKPYKKDFSDPGMMKAIRANLSLGSSYTYMHSESKMYDNLSQLLTEKGFNAQAYFPKKEDVKKLDAVIGKSGSPEAKATYENYDNQMNKNNEALRAYYEKGDFKKIRELFKIGNGFSTVVVSDYIDGIKNDYKVIEPFSSYYFKKEDSVFDLLRPAEVYSKYTGTLTPEKEKIYKKDIFDVWYRP